MLKIKKEVLHCTDIESDLALCGTLSLHQTDEEEKVTCETCKNILQLIAEESKC